MADKGVKLKTTQEELEVIQKKQLSDLHDTTPDPFKKGVRLPLGQLTGDDQYMLKKYSEGKDLVVELGSLFGRSASILSLFAKKVIAIDLYDKGAPANHENNVNLFKDTNVTVIKNWSHIEAFNFENNSIDFLFIDAGHSFFHVLRDFYCYISKVKTDGFIAFHDYANQLSVRRAVDHVIAWDDGVTGLVKEVETIGWSMVVRKVR